MKSRFWKKLDQKRQVNSGMSCNQTDTDAEKKKETSFSLFQHVYLALIYFYQRFISPRKPPTCRFSPTCSTYAKHAIERHGAYRGGLLACHRILRCHPFHPGGDDSVP